MYLGIALKEKGGWTRERNSGKEKLSDTTPPAERRWRHVAGMEARGVMKGTLVCRKGPEVPTSPHDSLSGRRKKNRRSGGRGQRRRDGHLP